MHPDTVIRAPTPQIDNQKPRTTTLGAATGACPASHQWTVHQPVVGFCHRPSHGPVAESERTRPDLIRPDPTDLPTDQAATTSTASAGALMVTRSVGTPATDVTETEFNIERTGAGTGSVAAAD